MTSHKTTVFNNNANSIMSSIYGGELTGISKETLFVNDIYVGHYFICFKPMSFSNSLVLTKRIIAILCSPKIIGNTDYCRIERSLEDKFLDRQQYFDYPLPGSVLSTIAIAISSDGT